MADKLIITWEKFHRDCEALAEQIKASGQTYTGLVALARGGLPVAGLLAQLLDIKDIDVLCLESYSADNEREAINYISGGNSNNSNFLVVDDLVDSGNTLEFIKSCELHEGSPFDEHHTAVLYRKTKTKIEPTFFVENISAERWIVFPWENN